MPKTELRDKYKMLRMQLTSEEIEELSLTIANNSLDLAIWEAAYYHVFLSITEKQEINTEYLLHILQGKDKSIAIPKANFDTGDMKHILLQENTLLRVSNYGIPEPESGIEIPSEQIEVVFVPLLAFDIHGNRIGYGKGFYDRFLAKCNPKAIFVGLSFFEAEDKIINEFKDISLHFCITPHKVYSF
jgi:5-formyltetrahydrofolate cyclo-ligase